MKQVYYDEGWSDPNKYTFEVYQLDNGTSRALARTWNGKINKVQQETQFLSDTREGLKHQDYPPHMPGENISEFGLLGGR